jgi:hypothetical protein
MQPVDVGSVIDAKDAHDPLVVVEFVDDAIRTSARRPQTGQLPSQGMSHPSGVLRERPEQELDDRDGDCLGKAAKGSLGGRGYEKLPSILDHYLR